MTTRNSQIVKNTINTFNYILLRDTIDKMNADKNQTRYDVINNRVRKTQKANVSCQFRYNNQSHLCNSIFQCCIQLNPLHSIQSNSLHSFESIPNKSRFQKAFVTTNESPQFETNLQLICKKSRAPNKPKMAIPSKTFNSISTQTEGSSNKYLGRASFREDPDAIIYPLGNEKKMPQYRKNFSQVFGEEFLAKATQKECFDKLNLYGSPVSSEM